MRSSPSYWPDGRRLSRWRCSPAHRPNEKLSVGLSVVRWPLGRLARRRQEGVCQVGFAVGNTHGSREYLFLFFAEQDMPTLDELVAGLRTRALDEFSKSTIQGAQHALADVGKRSLRWIPSLCWLAFPQAALSCSLIT